MPHIDTQQLIPILEKHGVVSAGFFGSYARGEHTPNDIDILIELKEPLGFFKFLRLQDELAQKLNQPVDLVTRQALSPYIRDQILSSLKIFYERK